MTNSLPTLSGRSDQMHHLKRRTIPFTSIVGQEDMKLALILNAVNPRIGGVLIRGDKGTAKSTAVRALADLLDEISVADGCPFNCHPSDAEEMCDLCFERLQAGKMKGAVRRAPVVDLPLGATEDRVVGSLNVERAIKEGIKALEPGIMAAANRGILYIDEVNLLDDHVADVLLDSAAMGVNVVEREGISVAHPARFILVGTMNPEEGELRPQLLDRFGLQVNVAGIDDVDMRVEIAKRAERFEADPEGFAREFDGYQQDLREKISGAKKILGEVTIEDDLLRMIASTCIDLGVKTHRAEIVISRTARTIASFEGRREVDKEDVRRAMVLALAHRMRSRPFEPPTLNRERLEKSMEEHQKPPKQPPVDEKAGEGRDEGTPERQEGRGSEGSDEASGGEEKIFDIGDPIDVRRIDVSKRRDRTDRRKARGRRIKTLARSRSGRYLRHRMPQGGRDIAIDATIRAAAPHQRDRDGPNAIKVRGEDIRERERVRKTSAVVVFVVDASGSMGSTRRMESAKGAVLSMLMDSYQKRDKIGMVAFKGEGAEMLLPPSSSVDLALKRLEDLPTGGKTPLYAGLSKGLQLLKTEMRRDGEAKTMMVLISDGRANVSLGGKIRDEIREISATSKEAGVETVVIDTEVVESSFMDMRLGYCRDIAEASAGRYYPISSLSPEALYSIVEGVKEGLFEENS